MNDQAAVDRKTIRVSERGQEVLTRLTSGESALFKTDLSAYLAAAVLAVSRGLTPLPVSEITGGQTTWNRGSGAIAQWESIADLFLETPEPITALMGYAEAGLAFLDARVDRGRTPAEIFNLA